MTKASIEKDRCLEPLTNPELRQLGSVARSGERQNRQDGRKGPLTDRRWGGEEGAMPNDVDHYRLKAGGEPRCGLCAQEC